MLHQYQQPISSQGLSRSLSSCAAQLTSLVEEVAGHQNANHENKQQTQVERSPVQLYGLLVGVRATFHSDNLLALNELHGRDRAQEEHRRYCQCVN
ncbi:hypothetical protein AMR42_13905 [Limnothrix sp. PR1529]|nr:hypothetical protein BCR12_15555 [Limnothrix sp. P13C2]PIB08190.1 hypothetical protein AMR42_13905 [Limnothrix sp. PR1529]